MSTIGIAKHLSSMAFRMTEDVVRLKAGSANLQLRTTLIGFISYTK